MKLKTLEMQRPLTSHDIHGLFPGAKIIPYSTLSTVRHINQLFRNTNVIFLLFETEQNFGHWTVIKKYGPRIFFFDPYGFAPDQQLKFTDPDFRVRNGMNHRHLTRLLEDSGYQIRYNPYAFQNIKDDNAETCGRWASLFARLWPTVSIEGFRDIFEEWPGNLDDAITTVTHFM